MSDGFNSSDLAIIDLLRQHGERHDAARDVESLDHFKPPRTGFRV